MKVKIITYPKHCLEIGNVFFTSDLHINHESMIKFGRKFSNVEEMNHTIYNNINKKVGKNDLLVLLGDTMMVDKDYNKFLSLINCENVIMLYGNHCNPNKLNEVISDKLKYQGYYLEIIINNQIICCSHYPMFHWNFQSDGSFMLHGHCVDINTEILTTSGWKNYKNINNNDIVYSITTSGIKESKIINKIIKENYNKDVYLYNTRFSSICVTDKHRMIEMCDNELKYCLAKDFFNKHSSNLILTGYINKQGLDISDDLLILYIFLVADGSYNKITNLARTSLYKYRKIYMIENLLERLNIPFTKNSTKKGRCTFNFKLPTELKKYNIKGLDIKLLECSEKQVDIIVDTYSKTDGNKNNNTVVIYSSKKEEIELLQHLLCINNYSTTVSSRFNHGFSKKESFQLSVSKNRKLLKFNKSLVTNKLKIIKPTLNIMWCIETELGNFMCRRNGKTYFTGNCHGDEPSDILKEIHKHKSLDVGIDNYYNIFGTYDVFSLNEIQELLNSNLIVNRH
jgi:calcineurin-like phosphoesterase family protein